MRTVLGQRGADSTCARDHRASLCLSLRAVPVASLSARRAAVPRGRLRAPNIVELSERERIEMRKFKRKNW